MARKRSGAQRRQAQKEAARIRLAQAASDEQDPSVCGTAAAAAAAAGRPAGAAAARADRQQPTAAGSASSSRRPQMLVPEPQEVVAAIASLYIDELKPFGRILRKRILERHTARLASQPGQVGGETTWSRDSVPGAEGGDDRPLEVDANKLRKVCEGSKELCVSEESGDWSVVLQNCGGNFVDVYSQDDPYSDELWREAEEYFGRLDQQETPLPGGRYSCAQELLARQLPFLKGCSLGAACHIVQLAISRRKLLGYLDGAVVPYGRSQSMLKERCAQGQQPCAPSKAHSTAAGEGAAEGDSMTFATWEDVRRCVRQLLLEAQRDRFDGAPGVLPLSNVKRVFRSRFHLELSETVLGHSKLSELLVDARVQDLCTVRLDKLGYSVVQVESSSYKETPEVTEEGPTTHDAESPLRGQIAIALREMLSGERTGSDAAGRKSTFCIGEPLALEEAFNTSEDMPSFGPTPHPLSCLPEWCPGIQRSTIMSSTTGPETVAASGTSTFCVDEPLALEDAFAPSEDMPTFGATPHPLSCLGEWRPDGVVLQEAKVLEPPSEDSKASPSRSFATALDSFGVQNTFLHAALSPMSPPPGATSSRRSSSLPKNIGSDHTSPTPKRSLEDLRNWLDADGGPVSASTSARSCGNSSATTTGDEDKKKQQHDDLLLMPPHSLPYPGIFAQAAALPQIPPLPDYGSSTRWPGAVSCAGLGFPQPCPAEVYAAAGMMAALPPPPQAWQQLPSYPAPMAFPTSHPQQLPPPQHLPVAQPQDFPQAVPGLAMFNNGNDFLTAFPPKLQLEKHISWF